MQDAQAIRPEFSYRFTFDDFKATYGNDEGAIAHGDFMVAAQLAETGSELKGCALILSGLTERGLEVLAAWPHGLSNRGKLCQAFALWMLDRDEEARGVAETIDDACGTQGARLRELLRRDDITAFVTGAILSIFPEHHDSSIVAPAYRYGPITAKYVGSQMPRNAYNYSLADPFDKFIAGLPADEKPDFIFALSPQWLLPKNFHRVVQPKVLWCHDSDVFIYRNHDNYALYDVAICSSSHEHYELSRSCGLFCASNIMLHPMHVPFPEASLPAAKPIDVIFTGSALQTFHTEKPRFMHQLAGLANDYNVVIIDSHIPEKDYFKLLSQSKFLPIVGRHAGAPSPRWRDALTNGACVLYPEGSFYDEIVPGCFPFRADSIAQDIRKHIDRFNSGTDQAYDLTRIVPEVNRRFARFRHSREKSFEQLLKYAAFMALVWREPDPKSNTRKQQRRRLVWLTPGIDAGIFGRDQVREKVEHTVAALRADELRDDRDYDNSAHIYGQLAFAYPESSQVPQWARRADRYFTLGLGRYPNSLLLRFNRAMWDFFNPVGSHTNAVEKFQAIIDQIDQLEFDPQAADVGFAYTLLERDAVFPYYEYSDVVTSELVLRNTPQVRPRKPCTHSAKDILLSACHGYLGWSLLKGGKRKEALARFEQGIEIFPSGLPLLRLHFETLLRHCLDLESVERPDAIKLADAFSAVASIYPTILLTHIFPVVTVLVEGAEEIRARLLLNEWYRLGNVIHSIRPEDHRYHGIESFLILYEFRSLFPDALVNRIRACLRGDIADDRLTRLEQLMVKAARRASEKRAEHHWRKRATRWAAATIRTLSGTRRKAVQFRRAMASGSEETKSQRQAKVLRSRFRFIYVMAAMAGGSVYENQRLSPTLIRRALVLWWSLPPPIKSHYVKKTWAWTRNSGVTETVFRIQQWATASKWSRQSR